jgi:hypothetical protein
MEPLYDPDPDEIIQSKIKNAQSSLFTLFDRLADLAADRTAESSVILADLENLARVLIQRMHEICSRRLVNTSGLGVGRYDWSIVSHSGSLLINR